jgi:hypothetical protein
MKRLQGEKEKRLAEMGKIDTLDEKIPVELDALKEKVIDKTSRDSQYLCIYILRSGTIIQYT